MAEPLTITVRCPVCGHSEVMSVPTDRCILAHACTACGAELRRKPGKCCVFCSHESPGAQAGAA